MEKSNIALARLFFAWKYLVIWNGLQGAGIGWNRLEWAGDDNNGDLDHGHDHDHDYNDDD